MLNEINVLREKLEMQILENESYENILKTSKQIDVLLVEYYNNLHLAGAPL